MSATLFDLQPLPAGFLYQPDFLSAAEERALIDFIERLPFEPFAYRQFTARRRVVHYGWSYSFGGGSYSPAPPVPDELLPLRARAAELAAVAPAEFEQAMVTEYEAGTPIGWHRDLPVFGLIVGISLAGSCQFRFRRGRTGKWERASLRLEPRSAYLLSGPARSEWQHSIPPTEELRYSITFRTLRQSPA